MHGEGFLTALPSVRVRFKTILMLTERAAPVQCSEQLLPLAAFPEVWERDLSLHNCTSH